MARADHQDAFRPSLLEPFVGMGRREPGVGVPGMRDHDGDQAACLSRIGRGDLLQGPLEEASQRFRVFGVPGACDGRGVHVS